MIPPLDGDRSQFTHCSFKPPRDAVKCNLCLNALQHAELSCPAQESNRRASGYRLSCSCRKKPTLFLLRETAEIQSLWPEDRLMIDVNALLYQKAADKLTGMRSCFRSDSPCGLREPRSTNLWGRTCFTRKTGFATRRYGISTPGCEVRFSSEHPVITTVSLERFAASDTNQTHGGFCLHTAETKLTKIYDQPAIGKVSATVTALVHKYYFTNSALCTLCYL